MVNKQPQNAAPRRFTTNAGRTLTFGLELKNNKTFPNVLMGKLQNVDSKSQRPGNFELLFVVICVGCLDLFVLYVAGAGGEKPSDGHAKDVFFFFSGGGFS